MVAGIEHSILTAVCLALGFVLPGALICALCLKRVDWIYSYIFSLLSLYSVIFWTNCLGIELNRSNILYALIAITALLSVAVFYRKPQRLHFERLIPHTSTLDKLLILPVAASVILLSLGNYLRSFRLADSLFRWELLPRMMFKLGNLDFYPPITPKDFLHYFYIDSIPPIVQFSQYWTYASFDARLLEVALLHGTFQFIASCILIYRIAAKHINPSAGGPAVLIFCTSYGVSYTFALSAAAGLLVLLTLLIFELLHDEKEVDGSGTYVALGMVAAAASLTRDYGGILLALTVAALICSRRSRHSIALTMLPFVALALPWFLRIFIISGNPFYSVPWLQGIPVNPVLAEILQGYASARNETAKLDRIVNLLPDVLRLFLFPLFFGILGGCFSHGLKRYSLVALIAAWTFIWAWSENYSYGAGATVKVLAPAAALLSIVGGGAIIRINSFRAVQLLLLATLAAFSFSSALYALSYPLAPKLEYAMHPPQLKQQLDESLGLYKRIADELRSELPQDARVLSHNAMIHAELVNDSIEVVPVWSPEVTALTNEDTTLDEGLKILQKAQIDYAYLEGAGPNDRTLRKHRFYNELYRMCYPDESSELLCSLATLGKAK